MDMPTQPQVAHLVLAHGAGAGMDHPWIVGMAATLATVGVAATRYNFPFMQGARRPPDKPAVLMARVREAAEAGRKRLPRLPLLAGGKSLGGRMTAYAQAESPIPHVRGLVFFGFPLHPAKKAGVARAVPLADIGIPMLFLQGTRDPLADRDLMRGVCERLGKRAALIEIIDADHSFAVLKRTGKSQADVHRMMAAAVRRWFEQAVLGAS